jgi:hypothetical protein
MLTDKEFNNLKKRTLLTFDNEIGGNRYVFDHFCDTDQDQECIQIISLVVGHPENRQGWHYGLYEIELKERATIVTT